MSFSKYRGCFLFAATQRCAPLPATLCGSVGNGKPSHEQGVKGAVPVGLDREVVPDPELTSSSSIKVNCPDTIACQLQDSVQKETSRTAQGANCSPPAQLMAAKAALKEHRCLFIFSLVIQGYRVLEISANCGLLAIMTWWLEPLALAVPFLFLWYLPAVCRCGLVQHTSCASAKGRPVGPSWWPWVAPLRYPILMFAADDFSWLRLHPNQRSAWCLYTIYVLRVLALLVVIPVCSSGAPEVCKELRMINEDPNQHGRSPLVELHEAFAAKEGQFIGVALHLAQTGHSDFNVLTIFWAVTAEVVMCLSMVWTVLTIVMVVLAWTGSFVVGRRHECLLQRVRCIAAVVQRAMDSDDAADCRRQLECLGNLEESAGGTKKFSLTSAFNPFKPNPVMLGVSAQLHIALKLFNAYTFASSSWSPNSIFCSVVLLLSVLASYAQQFWLTGGNPCSIFSHIRRSLASGIFTPELLQIVETDKGLLALPAFVISVSALPWTIYQSPSSLGTKVCQALGQVAGVFASLVGTGTFAFQEFDLGVERQGLQTNEVC